MNQFQKDSIAFFNRLNRVARKCTENVLNGKPRCHFTMLHGLAAAIETEGSDGSIYVSDLARTLDASPQAVSRSLRILEQDGLAERCTDPNDRRKTMVRLTQQGQQAHDECAAAMDAFGLAVMKRLGTERLQRMYADFEALIAAMEAESAE